MAFTMHSHSGQFCPGHAKDQLEDIIKHAISLGFKTMGLTEHMPRYQERDLYPEERDHPDPFGILTTRHEAYLVEAQRLQKRYESQIHIIIAFEAEFIRPEYAAHVALLAEPPCVDYFIGSVHYVHGLPIDYDRETYAAAVAASSRGGSEEGLYEDYYDLQFDMFTALKPRVVGHFDLIRLMSEDPGRDVRRWDGVWERIVRNLKLAKEQGGLLECNTSALRKGLDEPYPCWAIAEEWLKMGGRFTMSDDSHGIAHLATNYSRALTYLESLGVTELWTFRRTPHPGTPDRTRAKLEEVAVPLTEFRTSFP
ncbi:histidinol-phosphatase-like protein [Hapsidospora chrysogenum ATCC 11550]|uniref:Histidinol-phosphatase n=1 Tax=Hapsidospora chrysogenum (strain ATCC 11550 / CBS 779.69 / DSM 880 / IAM 14645 / JCM 23072 / IMI 49137) TaxID=857340 RepID=A0A086T7E8_HAPC1|nr:histidinol-phosphatase-like protein [Hapsidospora chrysogenum ATCC 11550]